MKFTRLEQAEQVIADLRAEIVILEERIEELEDMYESSDDAYDFCEFED